MEPASPTDEGLYRAILERHSVRRYDNRRVPEETRRAIVEFAIRIRPLVPANRFSYSVEPIIGKNEDLAAVMGGYGKLVSARHLVLPMAQGESHVTEDFGFRAEQLVVHLTRLGLGSCYIGALGHEAEALDRFEAPVGARVPAVIVFGYPASGTIGRNFNRSIRAALGANHPSPFDRTAYRDRMGLPARLTGFQEKVLDALRRAPSAGNSRPWRVVLRHGICYLSVKLDTPYYRIAKATAKGYHLVDAGIGMANISLALAAFGADAEWTLLDDDAELRDRLGLPDNHQLIGSVPLSDN